MHKNVLAAILLVTVWVTGASSQVSAPLTVAAPKNAEYFIGLPWINRRVKLTNGVYEPVPPSQQALLSGDYLRVAMGQAALGSLRPGGQGDAAVILATSSGGSGVFMEVVAVLNEDGKPRHVASADLGDRVKINSLAIRSGRIVIDMITHGPHDPACCPTVRRVVSYRLTGDRLVP